MKKPKLETVSTQVEPKEFEQLEELARLDRSNRSTILRKCIAGYLPELQRILGAKKVV
jgi:hypothetical protein